MILLVYSHMSQFWMDLLYDLKERQLFNGSHEQICLMHFVFVFCRRTLTNAKKYVTLTPLGQLNSLAVLLVNQMQCTLFHTSWYVTVFN